MPSFDIATHLEGHTGAGRRFGGGLCGGGRSGTGGLGLGRQGVGRERGELFEDVDRLSSAVISSVAPEQRQTNNSESSPGEQAGIQLRPC